MKHMVYIHRCFSSTAGIYSHISEAMGVVFRQEKRIDNKNLLHSRRILMYVRDYILSIACFHSSSASDFR